MELKQDLVLQQPTQLVQEPNPVVYGGAQVRSSCKMHAPRARREGNPPVVLMLSLSPADRRVFRRACTRALGIVHAGCGRATAAVLHGTAAAAATTLHGTAAAATTTLCAGTAASSATAATSLRCTATSTDVRGAATALRGADGTAGELSRGHATARVRGVLPDFTGGSACLAFYAVGSGHLCAKLAELDELDC